MLQPSAPAARRGLGTLSWRFWVVVLLTGVGTGVAGGAPTPLLYVVQHTAFVLRGDVPARGHVTGLAAVLASLVARLIGPRSTSTAGLGTSAVGPPDLIDPVPSAGSLAG